MRLITLYRSQLTIVFVSVFFANIAAAQDWHIGNPPVQQPVPQYQSNYPTPVNVPNQPSVHQPPPVAPLVELNEQRAANSYPTQLLTKQPTNAAGNRAAEKTKQPYGVDYSIYRDRNPLPIDPRKPCGICTNPPSVQPHSHLNWPGVQGRPYQEREPGGCQCGNRGCPKCNQFSVNWPAPFSAIRDRHRLSSSELRDAPYQPKRLLDVFDRLSNVELLSYQRTDNGYCGRGSDPYGCLGESRQGSRVAGVGYRLPGDPAAVPAPFNSVR